MHPTLEELLSVRDGDPDPRVAAHVEACETCRAEMERIEGLVCAMRGLPEMRPARDRWPEIRASIEAEKRKARRWLLLRNAAALLAVAVAIASALALKRPAEPIPNPPAHAQRVPAESVRLLVRESQRLEHLLNTYQASRTRLSGREAMPILVLEDRIATLDALLEQESGKGAGPDDLELLWRERVDLLNDLVSAHRDRGGPASI